LDLSGERRIRVRILVSHRLETGWLGLDLSVERRIWVRILVSRGFEAVNTVFGGNFDFGMKDAFPTRT
jgi:hypothetical protein